MLGAVNALFEIILLVPGAHVSEPNSRVFELRIYYSIPISGSSGVHDRVFVYTVAASLLLSPLDGPKGPKLGLKRPKIGQNQAKRPQNRPESAQNTPKIGQIRPYCPL